MLNWTLSKLFSVFCQVLKLYTLFRQIFDYFDKRKSQTRTKNTPLDISKQTLNRLPRPLFDKKQGV